MALARTDAADATLAPGGATIRPSFDVLDDVVRQRQSWGVLAVNVVGAGDCRAVAAHIERRARFQERNLVRAAAGVENVWWDVAARLGVTPLPLDPVDAARAIAASASARGAVVIVPFVAAGVWDEAVCRALVEAAPSALFVLLAQGCRLEARGANWFDLGATLSAPSAARWWDAALSTLRAGPGDELGGLERWLDRVIGLEENPERDVALSDAERDLLGLLVLARRAWPQSELGSLGSELALGPLAAAGMVECRDGWVAASCDGVDLGQSPDAALLRVAEALVATFPGDCWAFARSAELFARIADHARAESSMNRALALAVDSAARAQLWTRWRSVVESGFAAERGALCVRAAELALALGDVDTAIDWAEHAARSEAGPRALHLLGRAMLARGDLVAAEAALNRASELTPDAESLTEIAIDRAEVGFASGDLAGAERLAREVVESAVSERARSRGAQPTRQAALVARRMGRRRGAFRGGRLPGGGAGGFAIGAARAGEPRDRAALARQLGRGALDVARGARTRRSPRRDSGGRLRAVQSRGTGD